MIVFLTVIYVVLLLLAFKLKLIKPTLWWKLSPIAWMLLLLIVLFIPMQFWAPQGPLLITQYSVRITPNVMGEVIAVPVEQNVPIKEGDVLFRMDPTPYQAQVDTLEAQLKLAKTRLSESRRLARQGAGSRYDVEQFASQVEQLEGQLDGAKYNLQETTVTAPADGFVTNLALRPGQRVVSFPFAPALAFVETGDPLVAGQIFQNHLRYIEAGHPAEIAFKAYPGKVFDATVESFVPALQTGEVPLGALAPVMEVKHAPFWVLLELGEEAKELELALGATGAVAIYTDVGAATHIIRKVVIRIEAIKNYIVPF